MLSLSRAQVGNSKQQDACSCDGIHWAPYSKIAIPLGKHDPEKYTPRHIDVQLRSNDQAVIFRRILTGLDAIGARTLDGRRVQSNADVLRWVLDQVLESVLPDDSNNNKDQKNGEGDPEAGSGSERETAGDV